MTDPNYWLVCWQLITALLFACLTMALIDENKGGPAGACFLMFAGNLIAALYCAGFVVVMT